MGHLLKIPLQGLARKEDKGLLQDQGLYPLLPIPPSRDRIDVLLTGILFWPRVPPALLFCYGYRFHLPRPFGHMALNRASPTEPGIMKIQQLSE